MAAQCCLCAAAHDVAAKSGSRGSLGPDGCCSKMRLFVSEFSNKNERTIKLSPDLLS